MTEGQFYLMMLFVGILVMFWSWVSYHRSIFRIYMEGAVSGRQSSIAWLRVNLATTPKWVIGKAIYNESHVILADHLLKE